MTKRDYKKNYSTKLSIRKMKKYHGSLLKEAYNIWLAENYKGTFRYFLQYEKKCMVREWLWN